MRLRIFLAVAFLALAVQAQDILVVAPRDFQSALKKWRTHRESQGRKVAVQEPSKDIGAQVRGVHEASEDMLRFLLLVGDTDRVACTHHLAQIINPYERDPRIANDNAYADLDGDSLPELCVGRIPAETPAEAAAFLDRVIAYENNQDFSSWRRRVNLIAGVGGFGAMQDWAIETLTNMLLNQSVPAGYRVSMTYGNPRSPFCPHPAEFLKTVHDRFNEGALIVAYVGHGSARSVDRIRYQGKRYPILTEDDAEEIKPAHGAPISIFLACSTGKYDGRDPCLAETMLASPTGPVAIIASSRVSMPYANGMLAKELLDSLFIEKTETVGEMLLRAKLRLVTPDPEDRKRKNIEDLAASFYKPMAPKERDAERKEHVHLYNLFGDPSMRILRPREAKLNCAESVAPGKPLTVEGSAPVNGTALVELVRRRNAKTTPRPKGKDDAAAFREAYERANRRDVATVKAAVKDGLFRTELKVPADLEPGEYVVRVFVEGENGSALGATTVKVVAPPAR